MTTMAGVCSGVGGFDLAFQRSGYQVLWSCEVDPSCRCVLTHRFPDVHTYPDMLSDELLDAPAPDVFVGGTPCQGFSVAGLRKGLNDDRSNLALRFLQLADRFNPAVILWENVPGVLSDKGNAFGCFLAGLVGADAPLVPPAKCGGRWTNAGLVTGPKRNAAWRILDSQYFGLAQRRERVFVVASTREGLPFEVLFEPESVRRHSPPSRETGERVAPTLEGRSGRSGCNSFATSDGLVEVAGTLGGSSQSGGFRTTDLDQTGAFIHVAFGGNNTSGAIEIATACNAHGGTGRSDFESETFVAVGALHAGDCPNGHGFAGTCGNQNVDAGHIIPVAHSLRADGFDASEDGTGRGTPLVPVAFSGRSRGAEPAVNRPERPPHAMIEQVRALDSTKPWNVTQGYKVRRLTSRECERLQGFPDDFTLVPNARRKPMADGPRYKMMGNAVSVPVIEWLARRIKAALEK